MTLTEFLCARIAEECEQQIADDLSVFLGGVPAERQDKAARTHDRLSWTQLIRARAALRQLGWALVGVFWQRPLRLEAAKYASHPDYREEWRP